MNIFALNLLPAPQGQGGGLAVLMVQLGLIALVFYFLIIRPQGQARKRHNALLDNLKRGDNIMTSGGLIGKVKDIKDDKITVESGSASIVVHRRRIIQVGDAMAPGAERT